MTTTSYLEFYLSNFFSDLGGSLGLWLGVGILQVLVTQNVIDDSKSTIISPYLIIVADAVSVNFSGLCKFLQI